MKFRNQYQKRDWNEPTINLLPSMTQQEHEAEIEINNVMKRYVETGYLPPAKATPIFMDLSDVLDFDAAQDKILRARALFLDLPMEVKDEFRTADELLKAFQSERGRDKLKSFGFFDPIKEPAVEPAVAGSGVQPQKASEKTPAS